MKNETSTLLNAPPWSPIRGRIVGRLELLFVRDRGAGRTHRRLVGRYDLRGMELRDREIAVPTFEAAWSSACRVAKRERNKQRREELGNERAEKIQKRIEAEDRRKRAAEYRPDLNLTITREWLDAILFRGKLQEYRGFSNRQVSRLADECHMLGRFPNRSVVAVFRAGYSMDSRAIAVRVENLSICDSRGEIGVSERFFGCASVVRDRHDDWGEPPEGAFYALHLGRVLCSGLYSDVKDKLGRLLFVEGSNNA